MRAYIFVAVAAVAAACSNNQPQVVQNSNAANPRTANTERRETAIAHTTENQPGKPAPGPGGPSAPGKWSASGTPIDTAMYDGTIAAAEKVAQGKPDDQTAKKNLADAYYQRATALTEAQQYAAALGDYRRALKHDPNHEGSKNWIGQIEGIYNMLKKAPPKEGEEPPPLPFNKG